VLRLRAELTQALLVPPSRWDAAFKAKEETLRLGLHDGAWCIDHPEPMIVSGRPAQALALLDRARILSIGRLADSSYIGGRVRR
jgi:hypothetical protein